MNTTILPQVRFKTLKSVYDFEQANGWSILRDAENAQGSWTQLLTELMHVLGDLGRLEREMRTWSRAYRKQHGHTANPEDFLRANAERIREILPKIEAAYEAWVAETQRLRPQLDITELVATHRQRISNLWALDLDEPEEHQIQRMLPKPQPEPVPAQTHPLIDLIKSLLDAKRKPSIGTLPAKAEAPRREVSAAELEPLNAENLIAALDEAFANQGVA